MAIEMYCSCSPTPAKFTAGFMGLCNGLGKRSNKHKMTAIFTKRKYVDHSPKQNLKIRQHKNRDKNYNYRSVQNYHLLHNSISSYLWPRTKVVLSPGGSVHH